MKHVVMTVAPGVVSRRVDESYVVLDESNLTAHELVDSAAEAWTQINDGVGVDPESAAVGHLVELGLIHGPEGIGRRMMLKGIGGGIALFGVTSILLPDSAAALSNTGTLNVAIAANNASTAYCIRVPSDTTGTAHFSITGGGGGAGGLVGGLLGGPGGGGAIITGTLSGLQPNDIIVVNVGGGGTGGTLVFGGTGATGYDPGGNGAFAISGGGGGGGGATSVSVLRGAPASSCPVGNNTNYSGSNGTALAVAGAGGGGGSTGSAAAQRGGNGGTTNAGTTLQAGTVGKNGGVLGLFGGGGGGGGVGAPAQGSAGGGGQGGLSGWVNALGVTVAVTSTGTANNGAGGSLLVGSAGGTGAATVTFP